MNFGVLHSMDFARGRMEEFLCLQEGKGTVKADSPLEECRKVPYKPEELSLSHVSLLAVIPSVALGCTHTISIKASKKLTSKLIIN